MANSSDQIQADIARTRARMSSQLDQTTRPYGASTASTARRSTSASAPAMAGRAYVPTQGTQTNLSVDNIVEQMRQRPLLTLGLGLIAGSFLQDYLGGGQTSGTSYELAPRTTYPTYGAQATSSTTYGQPGTAVRQGVNNAASTVGDVAQSAGGMVSDAASGAVDTARDAASAVAGAASSAVDTTVDVAQRVADTTVDAAQRVADTTVDAAYQAMETVGDVAEEAYDRAGDLASTITNFVSGNPLMALGLSLAAGSLLQRYLRGGSTGSRPSYQSYSPSYETYQPSYTSYQERDVYTRPATTSSYQERDVYTQPTGTSSYGTSGGSSGTTGTSYGTSDIGSGTTGTSYGTSDIGSGTTGTSYGTSGIGSGTSTTGDQPAEAVGGVIITSTPSTGQVGSSTGTQATDSTLNDDSLNMSRSQSETNDQ